MTNEIPLSSDSLTTFQTSDPNKKVNNEEIMKASLKMKNEIIPSFAKFLDNKIFENNELKQIKLSQIMHQRGFQLLFFIFFFNFYIIFIFYLNFILFIFYILFFCFFYFIYLFYFLYLDFILIFYIYILFYLHLFYFFILG